jgi:L-alanine-DL-glutamate epimerase-like enolase superfamily enzyme
MKVSSGSYYGWSEIPASVNNPDLDLSGWIKYLEGFKGLTLDKARCLLYSQQVPGTKVSTRQLELIEMGLLDLSGRVANKPAIELLDLNQRDPVPGLFCILDKDVEKVRREAQNSIEQNLSHHLKFKMYGERELDLSILKTIREEIGESAMVISDVNKGYKKWKSLEELASVLTEFRNNGLTAIEDPAELSMGEWIQLQEMVGELCLIPDDLMRPSWKGINNIKHGMGRFFNLHPSTMGSFRYVAQMANKVKEIGAKVMIGDDSLVGPGCSAWQQIAIGAGASWVEAIEKKEDSKKYLGCLVNSPTKQDNKGYFSLNPASGFGVELDVDCLKKVCKIYVDI